MELGRGPTVAGGRRGVMIALKDSFAWARRTCVVGGGDGRGVAGVVRDFLGKWEVSFWSSSGERDIGRIFISLSFKILRGEDFTGEKDGARFVRDAGRIVLDDSSWIGVRSSWSGGFVCIGDTGADASFRIGDLF